MRNANKRVQRTPAAALNVLNTSDTQGDRAALEKQDSSEADCSSELCIGVCGVGFFMPVCIMGIPVGIVLSIKTPDANSWVVNVVMALAFLLIVGWLLSIRACVSPTCARYRSLFRRNITIPIGSIQEIEIFDLMVSIKSLQATIPLNRALFSPKDVTRFLERLELYMGGEEKRAEPNVFTD